jgi:hypothetical protein
MKTKTETPAEIFARENAETIFQMHIEGTCLYDEESNQGMSKEFIESIVDNPEHIVAIKKRIREDILIDVQLNPSNFNWDAEGKLTYDSTMYDYGFVIETYCRNLWNKIQFEYRWVCSNCGGQNIEIKKWVNPNTNEIGTDCEDEYGWCEDCQDHHEVELIKVDLNGDEVKK